MAIAAEVASLEPEVVAFQLINRVERAFLNQTLGKAQSHGRVVGPLARSKAKTSTSNDFRHRIEGAGLVEFDGRAQSVSSGQAEERAAIPFDWIHRSSRSLIVSFPFLPLQNLFKSIDRDLLGSAG